MSDVGHPELAAMFARYGAGYRWRVVVTVMLGTFAAVMEATIVNVALPDVIRAFHVGHDRVQLLSTGFLAATTASMLVSGWAMHRYGQRATYLAALWLLMLFSVLAAFTSREQFALLALYRIGQGAIAGLIQPLAMVSLAQVFPPDQRGRAMSAYGLGIVLSPAIGPVVGGALVDQFGWRAVFLVTLPFCLTAALLAPRYLIAARPPADARRKPLDVAGLALLGAGLIALLGGLSATFSHPPAVWSSLLLAGVMLGAAFVAWQRRSAHPLLDFGLFRQPGFGAAILVTVAYGVGLYGSTYLVPLFAQHAVHFSAFEAGAMLVPGGVLLALVLPLSGRLTDRLPFQRIVLAGLACFSASAALFALTGTGGGFWLLAAWVALGRVGLGLMIPGLNAGALRLLAPGGEAAGSAAINFFRQFGGAVGVTLLALFLEGRQRAGGADATGAEGFTAGFLAVALVYALAMIPARRMNVARPNH
jgi:EmrB/QacA subfamily drug resistance transporter